MTIHHICHTLWDSAGTAHLCGREADHHGWHLCACGEILLTGRTGLSDEQLHHRSIDCPECLARAGRPCHTTRGAVMTGVHAERARKAG